MTAYILMAAPALTSSAGDRSSDCEHTDTVALSDVLMNVRHLILQHEPLNAAFLLVRLADLIQKHGYTVSLNDWSDIVDDAAADSTKGSNVLATVQMSLDKTSSAVARQVMPPASATHSLVSGPTYNFSAEDQLGAGCVARRPQSGRRSAMPPIRSSSNSNPVSSHEVGNLADGPLSLNAPPTTTMESLASQGSGRNGWRAAGLFAAAANRRLQVNELRDSMDDYNRTSFGTLVERALRDVKETEMRASFDDEPSD
eukprot:TRINITY_DN83319_c0_g1_i1.p1 TRINITY_DN83319_c0_g1~~TRINITY_DN83319_c0_g1_i1.p1  ORF type:complete len:256 (-),score=18.75 TRINITY_DN83319_c0_g1_i1:78-845(-)